jgi:hypothetical protein
MKHPKKKREWKKYRKFPKAPKDNEPYEGVSGDARIILDLVIKGATPITEREKLIAKEIKEIEAKGYMVDLPSE